MQSIREKQLKFLKLLINFLCVLVELSLLIRHYDSIKQLLEPLTSDDTLVLMISILGPTGILIPINSFLFTPIIVTIIRVFYGLVLRYIWIPKSEMQKLQRGLITWLASLSTKWGKEENTRIQKIANTAEGILGIYNSNNHYRKYYSTLLMKATTFLENSLDENGRQKSVD